MKKLFTLLTLLLCAAAGMQAQTYTNEAATVTWAFTSHEDLTSTNVPADAFLTTNFSYGSNLTDPTTFSTKNCKAGWAEQALVYFKPKVTVAKGTADKAENLLEWTITPATGITFTPENVSVTACTAGGTGDPQLTIYAVYSDDTQETVQSQTNPRRPDKTDQGDGPSVYTKTLENAVNGAFKVRVYLAGLTNTGKGMAVTNIVVTGKVSGTPVATTTYTITAATNDASLGTATGTATVAENEEVTLTATPTAAGYFTKWQKDGVDFAGNTANPLTVTATADATYTAIFEAKKVITFDKGEGTGTAPATDYVLSGEDYTIPEAFFLYKAGATLTGWNDGVNTFAPGAKISNVTADVALTAVFADNTVALGDATTIVNWTFDRSSGAPSIACENSEIDYVQHTTISGTRLDAVMHVYTKKNEVIDGKTGKLNNANSANNGQVNAGTKFTIPVVPGAVIAYNGTIGTAEAGDITFGGESGSVSGTVTTYTYTGATGTLDIIDIKGGFYPSGITVFYPGPTVAAEIGSTGWATFCTVVPLDFTGISDVKAYIVTGHSGNAITTTQMTGTVPANTPLLLEGATTAIPVAASSSTDVSANLLKAGTGAAVSAESGKTKYVLSAKEGNAVFKKINATAATVPAGKAYLEFAEVISAPELDIVFNGDVTGISSIDNGQLTIDNYFDLQGRKVVQPAKGLYIVNGRKVIIK